MVNQIAAASLIAGILLGLGLFYGWRQRLALARVREDDELSDPDRAYYRKQARLRLGSCLLMLVLGGLLIANFGLGLEQRADEIAARRDQGGPADLDDADQRFLRLYTIYWIGFLLLLLGLVTLAGLDLLATRRYRQRHLQQIAADRRAMIEEQVSRIRHERNGHGGAMNN